MWKFLVLNLILYQFGDVIGLQAGDEDIKEETTPTEFPPGPKEPPVEMMKVRSLSILVITLLFSVLFL